ncbi:MAG: hypothetical protein AAF211_15910 [Myxococcota bacterium]
MMRAPVVLLLLHIGCGEAPEVEPSPTPTESPDPALFAACTFILGPDGQTGLVGTVDSLDADGTFDPAEAIEFADGRPICASDGESLFVSSPVSPEVTRYDLQDGALVPGPTVSFANLGIGPLAGIQPELMQFVSDDRAYLVDPVSQQVAVFDPTAMEVRGAIALDIEPPEGTVASGVRGILRTGDDVVIPFSLASAQGIAISTTIFAVVDTVTDDVTYATSTNCGSLAGSQQTTSGALVFASNEVSAVVNAAELPGAFQPCLLDKEEGVPFETANLIDLQALAGGDLAGGFARGPGNTAFFNAFDETIAPLPEGDPFEALGVPAWTVRRIADLDAAETSEPVLGVPPGAGRLQWSFVDGRSFVIVLAADFASTTLYEVTNVDADTPATEALTAPAIVYSLFRLR